MRESNSIFQWDSRLTGIVVALCVPVVGYALVLILFDGLASMGLMESSTMSGGRAREKTVALLAICCNLIPFNIFKKRRMEYAMRGCIFPTIILAGYWLYRYRDLFILW